ncbi:hypothetical protein JJB11_22155 [Ramlibacter ginsenosidimutans]|uniref:Uncharacterized protein n=1 Tax=Ramlibacter ginsenosidimutans TaxID=502333 RepID=A0A934WNE7_9BURK|nr:hypothetical protein [Ramlibacter ginsenosidimutans]MBK6008809.1 hypothetical protein [Ramlibacter ginsenosidimutans]
MTSTSLAMAKIVERMGDRPNPTRHMSALLGISRGLVAAADAVAGLHAVAPTGPGAADATRRLVNKVDAAVRELNDHARAGVMELEGAILQKSQLTQTPYASEIRAVYRNLAPEAAQDYLRRAVEGGDAETIAALCCVPYALTLIDPAQASRYRLHHEERCAPEEVRQRSELTQDLSSALLVASLARQQCTELLSPEAQRTEQAAERAEQALAKVAVTVGAP